MSKFAAPAPPGGGEKVPLADLNGSLLLIDVTEALSGVQTSFGPTDPVRVNVHVLDGAKKGERFDDTLIFPKVLAGQLRSLVGQQVVGRLGQGIAKPGQSAPWTLNAATPDEEQTAEKYLTYLATKEAEQTAPF